MSSITNQQVTSRWSRKQQRLCNAVTTLNIKHLTLKCLILIYQAQFKSTETSTAANNEHVLVANSRCALSQYEIQNMNVTTKHTDVVLQVFMDF